jgi:hypothetical protein
MDFLNILTSSFFFHMTLEYAQMTFMKVITRMILILVFNDSLILSEKFPLDFL